MCDPCETSTGYQVCDPVHCPEACNLSCSGCGPCGCGCCPISSDSCDPCPQPCPTPSDPCCPSPCDPCPTPCAPFPKSCGSSSCSPFCCPCGLCVPSPCATKCQPGCPPAKRCYYRCFRNQTKIPSTCCDSSKRNGLQSDCPVDDCCIRPCAFTWPKAGCPPVKGVPEVMRMRY